MVNEDFKPMHFELQTRSKNPITVVGRLNRHTNTMDFAVARYGAKSPQERARHPFNSELGFRIAYDRLVGQVYTTVENVTSTTAPTVFNIVAEAIAAHISKNPKWNYGIRKQRMVSSYD